MLNKGSIICFILLLISYAFTNMLDSNIDRHLLGFIGWFINFPLLVIGTILSYRVLIKYLKKEIALKLFLLNLPMMLFSVYVTIRVIYILITVLVN